MKRTSKVRKTRLLASLLLTLVPALALAAGSGSSGKSSTPPPALPDKAMSPEEKAEAQKRTGTELYDSGYDEVDRAAEDLETAVKLEAAGDEKSVKEAKKSRESAAKRYKKAIDKFKKTTELLPEFHEAWNMLGYSYRKTGQVGNAYKAYDTCLKLKPDYEPAHEYLGEAHLVAGNVEKAKVELEWLKSRKSDLASKLEQAIQSYAAGDSSQAHGGAGW